MQWRQQQLDGGELPDEEEISISNGPTCVKLAKTPHFRSIPIQNIALLHAIPGLCTSITRYVYAQDSGLAVVERWILGDDQLPSTFETLDLWTSFRISPECADGHSDLETFTVRCRPAGTDAQSVDTYDAMLIRVGGTAENYTLKGAKIHAWFGTLRYKLMPFPSRLSCWGIAPCISLWAWTAIACICTLVLPHPPLTYTLSQIVPDS
jgi:hypothetical protein